MSRIFGELALIVQWADFAKDWMACVVADSDASEVGSENPGSDQS